MVKFLYSFINCLIALFFILLGVIALILPWSPLVRSDIVQFILEDHAAISLFGFGFVAIGVGIIVSIIQYDRKRSYVIHSGHHSALVNETIAQHYLDSYWQQLFPKVQIPCRIQIKKKQIKIFAELPYVPVEEQQSLVTHIQAELDDILKRILGFREESVLHINFQSKKNAAPFNDQSS